MKYQKKQELVEAIQWQGNKSEIEDIEYKLGIKTVAVRFNENKDIVYTWHAMVGATTREICPKDWVVKRGNGTIEVMAEEKFNSLFEGV